MLHMLLLPFLPIVALIVQNSGNLHDMMEYRMESVAIGLKVDGTTALGHILEVFKSFPIPILSPVTMLFRCDKSEL